jgi:NADH-quinone oxidoreductase subunit H
MTDVLLDIGFSHGLAVLIAKLVGVVIVASFGLVWTLFGIWLERKIAGRFQDRLGPNRVGPFGVLQSFPDAVKILLKEDIIPTGADKWVFNIAPVLSVFSVMLAWVVVPFAFGWTGSDLEIGVLYLVAVGSLGEIAVLMAGWSSNNKFALLGAFRGVAQLVSYEVPMVLALLVPVLLSGSMSLQGIVQHQHIMYLLAVPMTFLIFFISSMAEMGRAPFDLLEAESELVAGYMTEYSGMKFGMFYVGEFLHAFTFSVLTAIFFLGGWKGPFAEDVPLLGLIYLIVKAMFAYFAMMWIRMTFPRVRIDQMLVFNWKFLVPLSLGNLLVVAFLWKLVPDTNAINSFGDALLPSLVLLVANGLMAAGLLAYLRGEGHRERERVQARLVAVDPAVTAGSGD